MIKRILIATLALGCAAAAAQQRPAWPYAEFVHNTSYTAPSGERVLRHEGNVPAPIEKVWAAFATSEGIASWMAPVADVELKTGGKWYSNYRIGSKIDDPDTIRNQMLSYIPGRMYSAKINLVQGFPDGPRKANTLFVVVEFAPAGATETHVSVSLLGWGSGKDWDEVWGHFQWGNGYTLGELVRRFKDGPTDWAAVQARRDAAAKAKSVEPAKR